MVSGATSCQPAVTSYLCIHFMYKSQFADGWHFRGVTGSSEEVRLKVSGLRLAVVFSYHALAYYTIVLMQMCIV